MARSYYACIIPPAAHDAKSFYVRDGDVLRMLTSQMQH